MNHVEVCCLLSHFSVEDAGAEISIYAMSVEQDPFPKLMEIGLISTGLRLLVHDAESSGS